VRSSPSLVDEAGWRPHRHRLRQRGGSVERRGHATVPHRFDEVGRDQDDKLGLVPTISLRLEKRADPWKSPKHRESFDPVRHDLSFKQPGNGESLPARRLDRGFGPTHRQAWNGETTRLNGADRRERAHFGVNAKRRRRRSAARDLDLLATRMRGDSVARRLQRPPPMNGLAPIQPRSSPPQAKSSLSPIGPTSAPSNA
jgi:hypothetical protein